MPPRAEAAIRSVLWLSLGGWIGAWAFFAFVVSRLAFRVLSGDVAGDLAGALLGVLHWSGAGLALLVAVAAVALGRRGWLVWLPIALALACVASELWLTPAVAAVRPSTVGPAATQESAERFRLLHALSLGLFLTIHALSFSLVVGHARLDARTGG